MDDHSRTNNDPRVGQKVLQNYHVGKRIKAGGMGAVYLGEDLRSGREVAIKFVRARAAHDKSAVARFRHEAKAAAGLKHRNIVEVLDTGTVDDGSECIVLEYLEGKDLKSLIREGPLSVGRAVRIVIQACDALEAAHANGIIHRDLKPANIFLVQDKNRQDIVKVLDFGAAKIRGDNDMEANLTRTGTTIGTPAYMSPEQTQGAKEVDQRTDIYSLGVVLFQSLCGKKPFESNNFANLVLAICRHEPPRLSSYRADLPSELERVVLKMMAKEKDERFVSCESVKEALAPFSAMEVAPQIVGGEDSQEERFSQVPTVRDRPTE